VDVKPGIDHQGSSAFEEGVARPSGFTSAVEFEGLLRVHDRAVRTMAYRLVGGDVDDVLQQAYLKAFEQRGSFRGDSSPSTWLHTIVYRTAIDHLRAGDRREANKHRVAAAASIADVTGAVDDRMAVDEALAQLSVDQRVILLLVDGQDMTYDDAAAVLGVANGTIASRIHRARAAIRSALESREAQ